MRQFTVSVCEGTRQQAWICSPYMPKEIKTLEDFEEAVKWDISEVIFSNYYRDSKYFVQAQILAMDNDNTTTENPEKWITPKQLSEMLPNVEFITCYSKSHMKIKHKGEEKESSERPRFHVFFPLSEPVTKPERLKELKEMFLSIRPEFDDGAKDAARCMYGVESPVIEMYEGSLTIDEYFIINGVELPQKKKKERKRKETDNETIGKSIETDGENIGTGERHNYLLKTAVDVLSRYSEQKARQLFDMACLRCKPQLSLEESQRIWSWATENVKQFKERQKKVLTPGIIDKELKKLGISVSFDVIRKELRVSDFPANDSNVPEDYFRLDAFARRKENERLLPAYLTSHFKSLNFGANEGFICSVLASIAQINAYNPVKSMLNATTHDGISRLPDLDRVLGIENDDMSKIFLRKWLHQALSLAFNDRGSYGNEFCLVLQGGQGIGKTTFFRRLAMYEDLFGEGISLDVTNKDSVIGATKSWICELGEIDSTLKREQAQLKSFLTAHNDSYRKPYARNTEKVERRTCFCGTVNPSAVLRDTTGARRFVIIRCEKLDKDFIFHNMTPEWVMQLWREVYDTLYTPDPMGFYLTDTEQAYNRRNNERYTVEVEGETELRDLLRWYDDNLPLETWITNWRWTTLTALRESSTVFKDVHIKSPKLGVALMRVYQSLGLNPDDFKRQVHGCTQYLLPPKKERFDSEMN